MKGDAQPLIKFFDGSDKRFIIPLYQRNYDWKEENCEQLFNDLLNLMRVTGKAISLEALYQVFNLEPKTGISLMGNNVLPPFRCC